MNGGYYRLRNGFRFGSALAARADVKRPITVANKEKQMFRAQCESVAISGFYAGRRLLGSWTRDLKPPVERNAVPSGSCAQWLEVNLVDPARRETLILMWTLQS